MIEKDPRHILNWPADLHGLLFRRLPLANLLNCAGVCKLFKERAAQHIANEAFALLSKLYYIPDYVKSHPVILANARKLPGLIKLLNRLRPQLQPLINSSLKTEWVLAALMGDEVGVNQILCALGINGYNPQEIGEYHYYAIGGHWEPFEKLFSEVEQPDPNQIFATCAARGGHWQFLLNLEQHYGYNLSLFDEKNQFTLLHYAIWHGHLSLVKNLIAHGVPTNSGRHLLLWAAQHGQWEIYDYLAKQDLELETPANFGQYLTIHAAKNASVERFTQIVTQYELAGQLPRLIVDRLNVFCAATIGNNFAIIQYLVSNNIFNINSCGKGEYHALHRAATHGHGELCLQLSKTYQLNNEVADVEGNNMLHFAVKNENWHCCHLIATQLLKDKIWQTNNKGENILHLAARTGNYWLVRNILENFGTEHLHDHTIDGNTALHFALLSMNTFLIELLITHYKMDINAQNNKGETPIHYLIKNIEMNEAITQFVYDLVYDYGADLSLEDSDHKRITMLLSDYSFTPNC